MPGKIVTEAEAETARQAVTDQETEIDKAIKKLNADIRNLPMVKVDKPYVFYAAPDKTVELKDLFGGKRQLIVYDFMFEPSWEKGCPGCSFLMEHAPPDRHFALEDTTYCAVSPGNIEKITAYKELNKWTFPWYSTAGNKDFIADFRPSKNANSENEPGMKVFFLQDGEVYHTYTANSLERFLMTYTYLNMTPLGSNLGPEKFKRHYE